MGSAFSAAGDFNTFLNDSAKSGYYTRQGLQQKSLLDTAASGEEARGGYLAGVAGIRGSQAIGQQTLNAGASGVDTQTGSPLDMAADTRAMSALDANMIRTNAARSAWGMRVKGYQAYLQDQANSLDAHNAALGAGFAYIGDSMKTIGSVATGAGGMGGGGGATGGQAPVGAMASGGNASEVGDYGLGGSGYGYG